MTFKKITSGIMLIFGALSLWEFATRKWENRKFRNGNRYWETYYPSEVIERTNRIRQTFTILSTGVELHIDAYQQPDPQAPVVIFNHGAAGYCRLFVPLALALYERGYTVILPDQRGQGFSGGRRGDYTIAECTQNIVDVVDWAKEKYKSQIFMMGGSVGGALTYYAAAADSRVVAIACLNLFDFGNGNDGLQISSLAWLAKSPRLAKFIRLVMLLIKPLHWVRLPFSWFGAFDKLMDARDLNFQKQWNADPIPPRLVSLRSLASNLNMSPAVSLEKNKTPVLVINQKLDQMVDPQVTQRNFERLSGPKKYLEIPFGHWSNQTEFWHAIVEASNNWFRRAVQA